MRRGASDALWPREVRTSNQVDHVHHPSESHATPEQRAVARKLINGASVRLIVHPTSPAIYNLQLPAQRNLLLRELTADEIQFSNAEAAHGGGVY